MKKRARWLPVWSLFLSICLLFTVFAGAAEPQVLTLSFIHLQISLPEDAFYVQIGPPGLDYWMVQCNNVSETYNLSICASESGTLPLYYGSGFSTEQINGREYKVYQTKSSPQEGSIVYSSSDDPNLSDETRESLKEAEKQALSQTYHTRSYVVKEAG